jgi:hypothetical protein
MTFIAKCSNLSSHQKMSTGFSEVLFYDILFDISVKFNTLLMVSMPGDDPPGPCYEGQPSHRRTQWHPSLSNIAQLDTIQIKPSVRWRKS